MSAKIGAISECSSFKIREMRPSGPAALPGLSLDSCLATPFTEMVISGMVGKHRDFGRKSSRRCFNFSGMSLVKTDWN